jgi:ribosomal protein S18 acetylase RimI-like enzyme
MPHIRTAEVSDARELAVLAETTFRATFDALNTPENMQLHCQAHFGEALQRREIVDQAMQTVVAEHGGRLIGFAQLRWAPGPHFLGAQRPVEIQRLYVSREWHGRGVAQDLMAAVQELAQAQGADQIWLGVWERNPRAIAFYMKCGFAEAGEHTFLLGSDPQRDVVMNRLVSPKGA